MFYERMTAELYDELKTAFRRPASWTRRWTTTPEEWDVGDFDIDEALDNDWLPCFGDQ